MPPGDEPCRHPFTQRPQIVRIRVDKETVTNRWTSMSLAIAALLALVAAPSAAAKTATVWAVGDGGDGGQATLQVGHLVTAGKPDKFLYLGDVYETGTAAEFASKYGPAFG